MLSDPTCQEGVAVSAFVLLGKPDTCKKSEHLETHALKNQTSQAEEPRGERAPAARAPSWDILPSGGHERRAQPSPNCGLMSKTMMGVVLSLCVLGYFVKQQ